MASMHRARNLRECRARVFASGEAMLIKSRTLAVAAAASAALLALALPVASQATPIAFSAVLSGLNESPPNASPATGLAHVTIDRDAHTMAIDLVFDDLLGPNIA